MEERRMQEEAKKAKEVEQKFEDLNAKVDKKFAELKKKNEKRRIEANQNIGELKTMLELLLKK